MNVCSCGHAAAQHANTEPSVCMGETDHGTECRCECYMDSPGIRRDWDVYVQQMYSVQDQIEWILTHLPYTRNYTNDQFVDFYKEYVKIYGTRKHETKYDGIRRGKQKVVADYPERCGPYDPDLIREKGARQKAMRAWSTT